MIIRYIYKHNKDRDLQEKEFSIDEVESGSALEYTRLMRKDGYKLINRIPEQKIGELQEKIELTATYRAVVYVDKKDHQKFMDDPNFNTIMDEEIKKNIADAELASLYVKRGSNVWRKD